MSELTDHDNIRLLRQKIIGLGERSMSKSYYPELRRRLDQLEAQKKDLEERTRALQKLTEDLEEERRKARESEANYRSVIDNIQDVFYRSDARGNLIMASPSFLTLLGYGSLDECLGKPIAETLYFYPEKRAALLRQIKEKGSVTNYEVVLKSRDGIPVTVETNSHLYFDDAGNFAGVEGTFRDVTERKRAEGALEESRRELETLLRNLPGMAYRCRNDREWTMAFVSEGCHALTGYTPDDLMDNRRVSYNEIIHPEDRETVWNQVQEALERRAHFRLNYRIVTAEGEVRWVWEQGAGVHSPAGELVFLKVLSPTSPSASGPKVLSNSISNDLSPCSNSTRWQTRPFRTSWLSVLKKRCG